MANGISDFTQKSIVRKIEDSTGFLASISARRISVQKPAKYLTGTGGPKLKFLAGAGRRGTKIEISYGRWRARAGVGPKIEITCGRGRARGPKLNFLAGAGGRDGQNLQIPVGAGGRAPAGAFLSKFLRARGLKFLWARDQI